MSDLANTIALLRIEAEASKTDSVLIGADDLIAILDAAEAGMRARDASPALKRRAQEA